MCVCLIAVAALGLTGCNQKSSTDGTLTAETVSDAPDDGSRPKVVATTTIVADLVSQIAGDSVDLVVLMPPGRDPHQFTLTARDVFELRTADLIIYNGLNLEEGSESVYRDLSENGVKTVAVTAGIPQDRILKQQDGIRPDPHVWGDPTLWSECVATVVDALTEIAPYASADFDLRGDAYRFELKRLDNWIKAQVEGVPWANPRRRVLVTSHDGFAYWGRAYQFEIMSLQGISTVDEEEPDGVEEMVDVVKQLDLPAIYSETIIHTGHIRRISIDAKVKIGGVLYSDSLGGDFTPTFRLRLLQIRSEKELPSAGVGNIFLGRLPDKSIHIRVFSNKGQKIFDRADRDISGGARQIVELKEQVKDSWESGYMIDDSEAEVVAMVKDIIDFKPPARNSAAGDDPGPETSLPLTGEDIDVRTYVGMMKFNAYKIASGLKAGLTPERLNEAAGSSADKGMTPER